MLTNDYVLFAAVLYITDMFIEVKLHQVKNIDFLKKCNQNKHTKKHPIRMFFCVCHYHALYF